MDHFFMMVQIVNDNGLIPVSQSGTHVRVTPNTRSTINHNKFQKMSSGHIWYELINYKFNMCLQNCNKHTRTFRWWYAWALYKTLSFFFENFLMNNLCRKWNARSNFHLALTRKVRPLTFITIGRSSWQIYLCMGKFRQ